MLMYRRLLAASAVFALLSGVAHAQDVKTAETLRDKALLDRTAWDVAEDLTTTIGPRIVGSPAMARAKDWGAAKLKALGFTNVKVEQYAKSSWTRAGVAAPQAVAAQPRTRPLQRPASFMKLAKNPDSAHS